MSVTILTFLSKKEGTTADQFKEHLESTYIPLLKSQLGSHYPSNNSRKYIKRLGDGGAAILAGRESDFAYDVLFEVVFADAAAFENYLKAYDEKVVKAVGDEELKFTDPSKTRAVIIGDVLST